MSAVVYRDVEQSYGEMIKRIQKRYEKNTSVSPMFKTDIEDLFDYYLSSFSDPDERQYHNCNTCKAFINTFGSTVAINDDGTLTPVFWDVVDAEPTYAEAFKRMSDALKRSKVTGVFLSKELDWGHFEKGGWNHFAVIPKKEHIFRDYVSTPHEKMAEKKEDFKNIIRAIVEYKPDILDLCVQVLEADVLYRSDKVSGPLNFLHRLSRGFYSTPPSLRPNVVWKAIAQAPSGFLHPRSSMAGTLLDDLQSGLDLDTATRKFKAKMQPYNYQRPKATPSENQIRIAEELVSKLGIEDSLKRRFAKLEDLNLIWKPKEKAAPEGGVFSSLLDEKKTQYKSSEVKRVSLQKFISDVLPKAKSISVHTSGARNFGAYLTASVSGSKPILLWDKEDNRNPLSQYTYMRGSPAYQWGITTSVVECTGISRAPHEFYPEDSYPNQSASVLFILKGCKDSKESGLALFPETLKSELRDIRSTIEAYSNKGVLEGRDEASACGLIFNEHGGYPVTVDVDLGALTCRYSIDRWD